MKKTLFAALLLMASAAVCVGCKSSRSAVSANEKTTTIENTSTRREVSSASPYTVRGTQGRDRSGGYSPSSFGEVSDMHPCYNAEQDTVTYFWGYGIGWHRDLGQARMSALRDAHRSLIIEISESLQGEETDGEKLYSFFMQNSTEVCSKLARSPKGYVAYCALQIEKAAVKNLLESKETSDQ